MKILVISDIHGSAEFLNKVLELESDYDYMAILGDVLYHGPRNDIPRGYNPKEVIEILNNKRDKIIAVRGNCDGEVDQMVLKFPIMSDYSIILYENRRVFLHHGHKFDRDYILGLLNKKDIVLSGHTHIVKHEIYEGVSFINPGSISIPKGEFLNSYGILENLKFVVKDLNGKIIKNINI